MRISVANKAALIHYDMVMDPANGYSQGSRWGGQNGYNYKTVGTDWWSVSYLLGDYDCASSVITAWRLALAGTPYEGALDGATYTGDMWDAFVGSGLFYADYSPARRGDVYLRPKTASYGGHTAMCQDGGEDGVFGYDCLTEFNRNEFGSAMGGQPGDQDGGESIIRGYYDGPWTTVLHYNGKADYDVQEEKEMPKQNAGSAVNDFGLKYSAHVQDLGWCPQVRDGQQAGTTGYTKRMEALRFESIPEGWALTAKAHIAGIGWVDYGTVGVKEVIGTTGQSRAIEALIIGVSKRPSGDKRKLRFRVHQQNTGWKGETLEGYCSGTDGMGLQLEAVKIWVK